MKAMFVLRTALMAALLAFGLVAAAPAVAQDDTPVDEEAEGVVEDAEQEAQDVTDEAEDEASGFDDWGLLGLLGLAGLAGLMRRPQPVVHETERTTGRVDNDRL